jgi:hypothetical protein
LDDCENGLLNLKKLVLNFSNFVSYKVGDSLHIRFWHGIWCGDSALKGSFPEFFSLARNKEALVSDYMDCSSPQTLWNLSFIRDVNDWEIESIDSFFYSIIPCEPLSRSNG